MTDIQIIVSGHEGKLEHNIEYPPPEIVADGPIELKEADPRKSEFMKWIESIGGPGRVARVLKVDRKTVWRYCNEKSERDIPELWIRFMEMSKELAEIKDKCAEYERRLGIK